MSGPQLLSAWAGHWTGDKTGVTVIVPPPGTVGSGEVRGGAPATREFALLDPVRMVGRVDAVALSGGSAFGLAAGDGVMRLLRSRGLGFPTPAGPVPIVVGMSLFDDAVADPPDFATAGREAALAALSGTPFSTGRVGAGTGATTGKWRGELHPSGLGVARRQAGPASIVAVIAVNAWGDIVLPGAAPATDLAPGRSRFPAANSPAAALGNPPSPATNPPGTNAADHPGAIPHNPRSPAANPPSTTAADPPSPMANTTIGVVLTDAKLDKNACNLLAQSAHNGFARALNPVHTSYDGDAVVALATGELAAEIDVEHLRMVTADVVAEAIRAAAD
ncbi:MAG: P1 family peptidase [Actinomycetota bacterium]|nr:P1 family peptidase [Actinomycetota bacterium]